MGWHVRGCHVGRRLPRLPPHLLAPQPARGAARGRGRAPCGTGPSIASVGRPCRSDELEVVASEGRPAGAGEMPPARRADFESMGIYLDGRLGNELRELEAARAGDAGWKLRAADLYALATMHYLGEEPLERMALACALEARAAGDCGSAGGGGEGGPTIKHILDVGSGYGGDANLLAERYACRVTALELQSHISQAAAAMTREVGGAPATCVAHVHGDITQAETVRAVCGAHGANKSELHDGAVSVLVILHVPASRRGACFEGIRKALRPGACLYLEDYYARGKLSERDVSELAGTVACPGPLPDKDAYVDEVTAAGFELESFEDMTERWAEYVQARFDAWGASRERHLRVHGEELHAELTHFYSTVRGLFKRGGLGGCRIVARAV